MTNETNEMRNPMSLWSFLGLRSKRMNRVAMAHNSLG
jgi:hypothetical protein